MTPEGDKMMYGLIEPDATPSPRAHRPGRRAALLALLTLAVVSGAIGCDTVAEISFDIRKFDRAQASGVAQMQACQGDDSEVELRFTLLDQESNVIRPGDQLATTTVSTSTFRAEDIDFREGRLYSTTPRALVLCASPCEVNSDCPGSFAQNCINGFCVEDENGNGMLDEGESTPHDACAPAGLTYCGAFDEEVDQLGRPFQPQTGVSFCRASCDNDGDCGEDRTCVARMTCSISGIACTDGGDECDDEETCENTSYCSLGVQGDFCENNADCGSGFDCSPIDGDIDARNICERDTNIEVRPGSLEFESPLPDGNGTEAFRAVSIVMDNSGSLFGRGVIEDDRTVRISRATDPNLVRIAAAKSFLDSLSSKSFKQNTVVSVWSFRGESNIGVRPLTGNIDAEIPNPYVANVELAKSALDNLGLGGEFGRSPVYEAIEASAKNFNDLQINQRKKTIIVFTDGPDDSETITVGADSSERDVARSQWEENLNNAISQAQMADAEVFILHLDAGLNPDGLAQTAADPRNAVPYPRDANGRTGPIAEYARIACETEGQYIYVAAPEALNFYMNLLVSMLGGTWRVNIGVDALGAASIPNGAYRLGANMTVTLDGRLDNFSLQPFGVEDFVTGTIESDDTRPILFRREGTEPAPAIPGLMTGGNGNEN